MSLNLKCQGHRHLVQGHFIIIIMVGGAVCVCLCMFIDTGIAMHILH